VASNTAKYLAGEAAFRIADRCFSTFGGNAFASEYDVERKWRETRLFRTAPVSSNMVLSFLSQHLGLPKSF
jgi:acyl-CoA dehydrogenase